MAQIDIYRSHYKQYYTVYKDRDWEMLPQMHQGVMNSLHILKKFLKEEEIVRDFNGWNPLSSKPQIKNIKEYPIKRRGSKQGRSPSSFYQKASSQSTSPRREEEQEKELEETIFPKLQDPKNPKRCPGKWF
ncbi:hypothetical protein O181_038909 [Austropuccinia psidii MF-1]|uniref:Uncharacterized protein n=1 Tax=Austropuccinia psidii MF-1 TaxID=1389203 RepID=A0A9Q3HE12_9BASI|nr:hypothetical protein [Austropuccinia psidii MF-1]